jgi:hypothetical protein
VRHFPRCRRIDPAPTAVRDRAAAATAATTTATATASSGVLVGRARPFPASAASSVVPPGYHTPYPGYPGQPGYRVATTGTNGFAIASLVLGILWFWGVTSILALVFGYIALRQVRERHENGRGMALAGVILGWIGIVGAILGLVLAVWVSRTSYPGPGM